MNKMAVTQPGREATKVDEKTPKVGASDKIKEEIKKTNILKTEKEPKAGSERDEQIEKRRKELLGEMIEGVQKDKKRFQENIDSLKETQKTDKIMKWLYGGTAVGMGALTLYALANQSIAFTSIALILTASSAFLWDMFRTAAPATARNIKSWERILSDSEKEDKKLKTQLSELEKTDKTQSS